MRIAMVGTGYVGLVSGACFSDFGHAVSCVDRDAAKIALLQNEKSRSSSPGSAP
jgi:UDPglucose 6-dehydrogenase